MQTKRIVFTDIGKAALADKEVSSPSEGQVLVETVYSAISAGTERGMLMDLPNTTFRGHYPKVIGYSGAGIVRAVGRNVTTVVPGDKVLYIWGDHARCNVLDEKNVIKIPNEQLDLKHAAFTFIANFASAGIRKTRLELGESAIVFGMGVLGAFAVMLCRAAGAFPVIAADIDEKRRALALSIGADYAFDPSHPDFKTQVKGVTGGKGPRVAIEISGQSVALKQALECLAPFGRVSLVGCTRVSDTPIDFYQLVHRKGVTIIGAHTSARPVWESYPGYWTEKDECTAVMNLMANGRIDVSKILTAVYSPHDAEAVYAALAENKNFPVGALFDWGRL